MYSHVSKSFSKPPNAATTQQFITITRIKHWKQRFARLLLAEIQILIARYRYRYRYKAMRLKFKNCI